MSGNKIEMTVNVVVSLVFINQLIPKPAVQSDQSAPLRLLYKSSEIDFVSAYASNRRQTVLAIPNTSKSLKLRCPVGRKAEKLKEPLMFNMKGFFCSGTSKGPISLHYEVRDTYMVKIKKLYRKMTYLPWSGKIQVSESVELFHEGFRPTESPSFSRLEYAKLLQRSRGNLGGSQIVIKMMMIVPRSAQGIQTRDEVGINWARTDRMNIEDDWDVIHVPLRSPLVGGMSTSFNFYYTIPADLMIKSYQSTSSPFKKIIQMNFNRMSVDVPVEDFKLTISLPEDSADLEYEIGTMKAVKVTRRTYRTYFSTSGEKEITFSMAGVTRDSLEKPVVIFFNYPFWGIMRKPLVAFSSLVFIILGILYLNRISLSLKKKLTSGGAVKKGTEFKKFFNKRRELLIDYEDLIASNLNYRSNSEQRRADLELKAHLDQQITGIESAIYERIKNSDGGVDSQQNTLTLISLKKLYDEQNDICKKILNDINSSVSNSASASASSENNTLMKSSTSSNSVSSVMKMSSSADILNRPMVLSKNIEKLAKEATAIDLQIVSYEAKFY